LKTRYLTLILSSRERGKFLLPLGEKVRMRGEIEWKKENTPPYLSPPKWVFDSP